MKALTLHRPWDKFVADGRKPVENRPWSPPVKMKGETFAIHAGAHWDEEGADYVDSVLGIHPVEADHPLGILGTVKLITWFHLGEDEDPETKVAALRIAGQLEAKMLGVEWVDPYGLAGQDFEWCFGPVCWIVREPRPIAKPIPCRGMQKLWNIPADVQLKLDEALKPK